VCLILVAWQAHPEYPLVVAANRDEFFDRPAAPAAWWEDQPDLLAGRDLSAMGSWLGITRGGRFAALTNFRDPAQQKPAAPSRGALVADFLQAAAEVPQTLESLAQSAAAYNGFNMLISDGAQLAAFESVPAQGRLLGPGIYGLSNHLLDTPWPKVRVAKSRLARALEALPDEAPMLDLLRDDRPAPDDELPRTGVSLEWERLLSSAFIRSPDYGTRCSTLICADRHGRTRFIEWTWDRAGQPDGDVRFEFSRSPAAAARSA
jgi:uncharacterized protein with NRDE domain